MFAGINPMGHCISIIRSNRSNGGDAGCMLNFVTWLSLSCAQSRLSLDRLWNFAGFAVITAAARDHRCVTAWTADSSGCRGSALVPGAEPWDLNSSSHFMEDMSQGTTQDNQGGTKGTVDSHSRSNQGSTMDNNGSSTSTSTSHHKTKKMKKGKMNDGTMHDGTGTGSSSTGTGTGSTGTGTTPPR